MFLTQYFLSNSSPIKIAEINKTFCWFPRKVETLQVQKDTLFQCLLTFTYLKYMDFADYRILRIEAHKPPH